MMSCQRVRFSKLVVSCLALLTVLACKKPNHPPLPPVLPTGTITKHLSDSTILYVRLEDPDGDMVSACYDWGDGREYNIFSRDIPSGDSIWFRKIWEDSGTFVTRVRAADTLGALTDWITGPTFAIGNTPPNVPGFFDFPDSGYPARSYDFWVRFADPDSDTVAVRLQWENGDCTSWSYDQPGSGEWASSRTWWSAGDYPIRAQARDKWGAVSDWSEPRLMHIRGPSLLWSSYASISTGTAPAVGPDGTIYFTGGDYLCSIGSSGNWKWTCRLVTDGGAPTPVVSSDGTVFVLSDDGYLQSVTPDGRLDWCHWIGNPPSGAQLTVSLGPDGTIYCCGESLYAFHPDGSVRWTSNTGYSPLVAADGTVYVAARDSLLYALSPDGSLRWTSAVAAVASPALGPGGTIICVGADSLCAIDPQGGRLWASPIIGAQTAAQPTVGADGTVYCQNANGVAAVSWGGTPKWKIADSTNAVASPLALSDGTIVVVFGRGPRRRRDDPDERIRAFDSDGVLRWQFGVYCGSTPSLGVAPDGTLYAASIDGNFYAIQGTSPIADSPWPMFQHDPQHTGRATAR